MQTNKELLDRVVELAFRDENQRRVISGLAKKVKRLEKMEEAARKNLEIVDVKYRAKISKLVGIIENSIIPAIQDASGGCYIAEIPLPGKEE